MPTIMALREVNPGYDPQPEYAETIHSFAINWIFGQKKIIEEFTRWLRPRIAAMNQESGAEKGGRKDGHLAALFDLAVYRLLHLERRPPQGCLDLLRTTAFKQRRGSYSYSHQRLTEASNRAFETIKIIGDSEKKTGWLTLKMMRMTCAHMDDKNRNQ